MLWDRTVQCEVIKVDNNYIDMHIFKKNAPYWRLTGLYDFLERTRRKDSCELIKNLVSQSSLPRFLFGDFNDMLKEEVKKRR